jgi:exonuclease III
LAHCKKENENQWKQEWGYKGYFSSHTDNSKGIAILINNTFKYNVHNEIIDKEGNYLILDITIQKYRITLVALYGPNNDSPNFFTNIQDMVARIQNTSIIMVGDWNVLQDYETDTANYRSQNNIKAQRQIIDMKNSLDLIDIWRAINPDTTRCCTLRRAKNTPTHSFVSRTVNRK